MWKLRLRLFCPFGGYGFLLLITALLPFMVIMGILMTTGKEILLSFLVFPVIFLPAFFLINCCNRSDLEKCRESGIIWNSAEERLLQELTWTDRQNLLKACVICALPLFADIIGMIFLPEWKFLLVLPGIVLVLIMLYFLLKLLYWKTFVKQAEICCVPVDHYYTITNRAGIIDAVVMVFYLPSGKYKIAHYPRFLCRTDTGEPYQNIYLIRTRSNIRWIPG